MNEPYISRKAGDFVTAKDWNDMQSKIREDLNVHTHSGKPDQGLKLMGESIDSSTALNIKGLDLTGDLKVDGNTTTGGALSVSDALSVGKDITAKGSLTVEKSLTAGGNVGIGTESPQAKLAIDGGLHVGGDSDPGDKNLQVDGTAVINDALTVKNNLVIENDADAKSNLSIGQSLNFGVNTRQMINLYRTGYGIGIQSSTHYFRTAKNFAWYKGGTHNNSELNAGGGTAQMVIKDSNVGIGTTAPRATLDVNGWVHMQGRRGNFKTGTVAANGRWQNVLTKLNHHNGFEIIADISMSGSHGLTHAIAVKTYMGDGASGGITKTQAYYGHNNCRIDIRWAGTTYDYNLQLRTMKNYGAGRKITYYIMKLW